MTDDRMQRLARAAELFIAERGAASFWRPTAHAEGIHTRTYSSRIAAGMDPEQAAKQPVKKTQPVPGSIRQRCLAMGYKSARNYQRIRAELDELGVEYTVDDVFDIIEARRPA